MVSQGLRELVRSVVASVRQNPTDTFLTFSYMVVLACVLDAGARMPTIPRPAQLAVASYLIGLGGYLFTCSSYVLPSLGMLLPGSDPRRKPLTSGNTVFGLCRHPQFAGLLALCLSICILSRSADRLFYTLLLMILLDKKADLEENAIVQDHPEYARYLLQVPKFIPNLNVAFFAGRAMARNESDPCVDPTTSLLHDGGAALPPEERERLDKLAAEGRHGATTGRLMDAHKVSR